MSIKDITDKIRSDARDKAGGILKEAKTEEDKLLKEAAKNGKKQVNILREQGRVMAEHRLRRMKQAARIHARKLLLAAKQEIMEEVFIEAKKAMCALPDNEYQGLLKKMLIRAVVSGDEEIKIASSDKVRLGKGWLKEVNEELTGHGKRGKLKFSAANMEQDGGFMLIRGKIHINCTFASLIKSYRDKLEPEIAKILFA